MTDRLYYDNAYLFAFDCRVEAVQERADGLWARLDRTAFYPDSGGQPHDTGMLSACGIDAAVSDVQADASGDIWHRLDKVLPVGALARGTIDGARRMDHMRQHGGDHLLAGAIWERYKGVTIGLHTGSDTATIDVVMPDGRTRLEKQEIALLEDDVNARIQADVPVRCWFPGAVELAAMPMRKPPAVKELVRVVAYGDFETVACGGTHPSSSGQIGLFKILDVAPARGITRFTFMCGMRALRHYRACADSAGEACVLLSAPLDNLPAAVRALRERASALADENTGLKRAAMLVSLPELLAKALPLPAGGRVIAAELSAMDRETLRETASALAGNDGVIALIAARNGDGYALTFARGAGIATDMALLLRAAGVRGGGKPDFAQGSAPSAAPVEAAARMLLSGKP
jgi:alanyl-tRNA synthetase